MKKIKIEYKLFLLFGVAFIGMIFLAHKALSVSEENITSTRTLFENSTTIQSLQEHYIEPLNLLREMSLSLVMSPNESFRRSIEQELISSIAKLDERFLSLDPESQTAWQEYLRLLNQTRLYVSQGFEEGAFVNANTTERTRYYELLERLKALQSKEITQAKGNFAHIQERAKILKYEVILAVVILSILVFLLGYFLSRHIVSSILTLQEGLQDFFDYLERKIPRPKPISLQSRDELEEMSKLLNHNILKAARDIGQDILFVENAISVVTQLKSGHLSSRLETMAQAHELKLLKNVINDMIDNLESKIKEEIEKRSEQEKLLIQQSKLASMGEMIGNIAHQWRQPLSELGAILMNLQVKHHFKDLTEETFKAQVERTNEITAFMSHTISDFQNFFTPSKIKEPFSVRLACEKAIAIIEASLRYHNIILEFRERGDRIAYGYPNEYSQVVLNILSNAKDALISREISHPRIHIELINGKNYSVVKIEDNAGGIRAHPMEKIFEPYFTTKHSRQGTGIGLYMSKMIIEKNMDGIITVENTAEGARFKIKIR
ncbi:MAG: HAMP domain-containing histidine kinase [Wolinella succinogenes]|uniref:sensor histidine kinase n=1 Tax=Wolinella succinogenes TaxID=844 RepID=UPI0016B5E551|nr:HAMP domain-containing sensor histidine kinase [Wolinella succinogenes]NLU34810.1 HAMP domain-containing histidine kinase [Wolinella succinogenes]